MTIGHDWSSKSTHNQCPGIFVPRIKLLTTLWINWQLRIKEQLLECLHGEKVAENEIYMYYLKWLESGTWRKKCDNPGGHNEMFSRNQNMCQGYLIPRNLRKKQIFVLNKNTVASSQRQFNLRLPSSLTISKFYL